MRGHSYGALIPVWLGDVEDDDESGKPSLVDWFNDTYPAADHNKVLVDWSW